MELGAVERLEVLSRDECLSLMATVPVGRLGVSVEALPAILPVNFALLRDRIIIWSVPGTKLDAATAGNVVAFEVDDYDPGGRWGWSVLVRGAASEITDAEELAEVRALPLRAWALGDAADRFLAIEATLVSGRRFGSVTGSRNASRIAETEPG
ncbi:MAG TPA: pyridoxamine 5'-phosphate oxidase family protein [Actinomycetota bacterium]|nr:pyridoxamine 5'-phosphate oxidase family protein [Actinomycetota bacterium]